MRYQVTATSFGQALAMLISVLIAGEDPQAQAQFDRILAFCLSHNSANAPELMSWQVMPDVVPGKRLDADLNAEPWIAFALLAAQAQWGSSERFQYEILARRRLEALLLLYQQTAQNAPESLVVSPTFYQLFAQVTAEQAWKAIEDSLAAQGKAQWSSTHAIFNADNSPEEDKMVLSILQLGIAELEQASKPIGKLTGEVEKRVRDSMAQLAQAELLDESALQIEPEGFSSLSLLACYTPAVLCLNDQALIDQQWRALTLAKPGRHDPIGATLRLLSLMQLSGNIWFDKVMWNELPPSPKG